MESVDVGDAVLLDRQIPLIHQTIQNSSGATVRHLVNTSSFFHCDFRVDAKTLSDILGHTNASFTLDTYTHMTTDMHRKAAGVVGGFLDEIM